MAGTKISALQALTTLEDDDLIPVVEVDNLTMAPSGSTMKMTAAKVAAYIGTTNAATDAETIAGVITTKAVTPASGAVAYRKILKANGSADESSRILAALNAMPSATGGSLILEGVFNAANITMPFKQNMTIDMTNAVINKCANGPVFTTPSGGWGNHSTFVKPHIDCKGATYTGSGIVVGDSSSYLTIDHGWIVDSQSWTIEFTAAGCGHQCDVNGTVLSVYLGQRTLANQNTAVIKLPNDAATAPNRGFRGIRAVGCLLVEDSGSQDTRFTSCEARNVNITGAPGKFFLTGSRLASVDDILFNGTQAMIVGNALGGNVHLGATFANSTFMGNVIAGDLIADSGSLVNQVRGNQPSTHVRTDSGDNYFDIPERHRFKSGLYYTHDMVASDTTVVQTLNFLALNTFTVDKAATFDRISLEVTTGVATAVHRLGIYSATRTNGYPDALILDAGTIDASTTGIKEITISLRLSPGLYWLGAVPQTAVGTVRGRAAPNPLCGQSTGGNANVTHYGQASITGALPANFSTTASPQQTAYPKVMLRAL